MCPKPNYSSSALGKKSSIEDLLQPIPSLFQSLISEGDTANRWITLQFPIDVDITAFKPEFRKLVQGMLILTLFWLITCINIVLPLLYINYIAKNRKLTHLREQIN